MSKTKAKVVRDLPYNTNKMKDLVCDKNMSIIATYLGYSDVSDLHRYQCSHMFLPY